MTSNETLSIYRDELTGGGLRVICNGCVDSWGINGLELPEPVGDLNDLSQLMQRCEVCESSNDQAQAK